MLSMTTTPFPRQPRECKQIRYLFYAVCVRAVLNKHSSKFIKMKFKVNISGEIKHSGVLSCLDWLKNEEVYTVG